MKILVAVDSFKGSLSSIDFCDIAKPILTKKGHDVTLVPISDGGEHFLDIIARYVKTEQIQALSYEPAGDMIQAYYLLAGDTAYIDLDTVVGMSVAKKLDALHNSTYGLGLAIKDAIARRARKIMIGIGGSATNDGGAGMLQAMGCDFYNDDGFIIAEHMNGELIGKVSKVDTWRVDQLISGVDITIACDVNNPLLGENGASRVYAKQKGASPKEIETLEANMVHFSTFVKNNLFKDVADVKGTGAAGGVGYGALAFLDAKLEPGIEVIKRITNLEEKINECDVVITGEGHLDKQSDYGKAPLTVAKLAKDKGKKTIGIFGGSDLTSHEVLDELYTIVPKYANKEASMKDTKTYLKQLLVDIKI